MILPEEIRRIEFLQNLEETHLNRIAMMARLEDCREGTVLFCEGQTSSFIYFVLSGTVSLEVAEPDGEAIEIATIGEGDLLGWTPVLGQQAMTATARALTRCRLAVLDAKQVLALCERDPHFGVAFMRQVAFVLASRLYNTRRCLAIARTLSTRSPLETAP